MYTNIIKNVFFWTSPLKRGIKNLRMTPPPLKTEYAPGAGVLSAQ